jgi:hypothetical protein
MFMQKRHLFSGLLLSMAMVIAGCVAPEPPHGEFVRVPHVQGPYQRSMQSPGAQFGALPPKVQTAVRAQAGQAAVEKILRDRTPVGSIYKIYFQNEFVYPPLLVTPEGDVLNPDYTIAVPYPDSAHDPFALSGGDGRTLQLVDVPEDAMKMIQEQAPHAEISSIEKQTWGDRTVYVVTFKGENASPKLYVRSDGIVLKEVAK